MTPEPVGAPSEGDDPLLGALVSGRYRLLEKLGEGGGGSVYRGVHETLRKPVAVKLLGRAARSDREMVTRFEREAVAAANLKHPNIAEATDSGQMPDGTLFLVMEYVQGRSLRAILTQDGRLPPARALHLLRQIGAGVVFAHGLDVVHRDLKPENIVVFDRGAERDLVKVIDFGIARMRSSFGGGPSGLTQVGTVVGTVEYMAPEQAMGQAVDARADQYALGVIAFELLTGQPPYVAEDAASLVYMHVGAPIPRVTERAPELARHPGQAIDEVVAKMMGKMPDERFPSLAEALSAMASVFDQPPPSAVPNSLPRPPLAAAAGAGASPALLRGAGGTIVSPERPSGAMPLPPPPVPPGPPASPPVSAPARKRDEAPIVLIISAVVSVLGLLVVLAIVFARNLSSASSDPGPGAATSASPGDAPATLAPNSHDKGKAKSKPRIVKSKHSDD